MSQKAKGKNLDAGFALCFGSARRHNSDITAAASRAAPNLASFQQRTCRSASTCRELGFSHPAGIAVMLLQNQERSGNLVPVDEEVQRKQIQPLAGPVRGDHFREWEWGETEATLKMVNVDVGARRPAGLSISQAPATSQLAVVRGWSS